MAVLIPSLELSSLAGVRREIAPTVVPRVGSRNLRIKAVSSRVKDQENVSTELLDSRRSYVDGVGLVYGIFSAGVKPSEAVPVSSRGSEEEEERRNYHLNTGYAIRTLREEFPELFYRELSFDIYRDDVVFKDPMNTFSGIENYKSIFWALRFNGRIFFKALWVDIVSVWQPSDNMIMVRWIINGIPRIPWESRSRFDGTSEYKLDKYGKIYEHKVHNIALNGPQKFQVLSVHQLIQSIGCNTTPKPTYFECSSSCAKHTTPFQKPLEFKRYFNSILRMAMRSNAER